jgi:hypothetical protein
LIFRDSKRREVDVSLQDLLETKIDGLRELVEERTHANERALTLQAHEYERRLDSLNHAHEKAVEVQHTYVTADKYEASLTSEANARALALDRIDEKFSDHVKRYELRQSELDLSIQASDNAAKQIAATAAALAQDAKDAAARQAEDARQKAEAVERRANRNLVVAGLLISAISVASRFVG